MPRAAAVSFHERTGRFPLTSSLAVVALLLLRHCLAEQTINNQQSVIGKTLWRTTACAANRSHEDLSRRYALSQPASVLFSATLQSSATTPTSPLHLLVRHVTGGLWPPTSRGRQHPSGLHSWPLTIRKEDHSVSRTTLFFLPTFKVQHPTSNTPITNTQHPAFSTTFHISESYLSSSSLGTTKECQDAICSLLPCNTAANLGCFFGKTQRMKYCASRVQ